VSEVGPSLTVCLSFDFDAMSIWLGTDNPSAISRGEFGAVGVQRLLALLGEESIPATFFVPGHTVLTYPHLIRDIAAAGHELGHHGWMHENPRQLDIDEERRVLQRGLDALEQEAGCRPAGWRSPAWDMSPNSIDLLLEFGFGYDSSLMGDDFHPYYVRRGDAWPSDAPFVFGTPTGLVEMPVYWGLDDFPPFESVPGRNPGLRAPSAVLEVWQGDFDFAYTRCAGGVYTLTMHPQVIGRGHRMLMLEQLIAHIRAHEGVHFSTVGAAAAAWKAANPAS
jgi:peptidoglycan/xylan/chitin deacetylase (PgdA/CDA1 family)